MTKAMLLLLLLVAATVATSTQGDIPDHIYPLRLWPENDAVAAGYKVNCLSWRLGVEAHNIIEWEDVPRGCSGYLRRYLKGYQYRDDSKAVVDEAIHYVENLPLPKDGRNIWIFDIDDTLLSNVPFFLRHGFGDDQNATLFEEWVFSAKSRALPESQKLYNRTLSLGIKPVLLTGRTEVLENATITNLNRVGYHNWDQLILKRDELVNKTQLEYKSIVRAKLEEEGYRIVGNIGDQWTDLLGPNGGRRQFKLPNPMYYAA